MLDCYKRLWHYLFMKSFDSATCPNCQTLFDRLPVERDEDAAYVVLEVRPCHTCGALLCGACSQFACDGCGQIHCSEHLVLVEDGTPRPLKCCAACAAECEPLELPLVAACCPDCGSLDLVAEMADHGVCSQTGYHDAQELYRCVACGSRGPAEEAERALPTRIGPQSERAAGAIAAKSTTA
jgi:hypothetical protein